MDASARACFATSHAKASLKVKNQELIQNMKNSALLAIGFSCILLCQTGTGADPQGTSALDAFSKSISSPGPFAVVTMEAKSLKDDARGGREVPMKIYFPDKGAGPFPVIVFSHGLGGSMEGYEYLGRFWASHGFVCAHVQHKGSDEELWKDKPAAEATISMTKAMFNKDNIVNRPKDISFAIDRLADLNANGPNLKGRLDMAHIGVGGHSFGAYTSLAIAGEEYGNHKSFRDDRVSAAIEMSAPGKGLRGKSPEETYAAIKIPMMHMTGTDDKSLTETPEDRLLPYKCIQAPHQFLLVFDEGDHMLFSGQRLRGAKEKPNDALYHGLIQKASTAFWMAALKGDKLAMEYLGNDSGMKKDMLIAGEFERK